MCYDVYMGVLRRAVLLLVALAALLLFPLGSSGRTNAENTWAGTWDSDFGKLTLSAGGSGSYEGFNPGTVSGTIKGDVLKGTWAQPGDPPKNGTFKFTMSTDGRFFIGVWAYAGGGCGSACGWSGTCVEGACTKNSPAGNVAGSSKLTGTRRARVALILRNKTYVPFEAELRNGGTLRICNRDQFHHNPFSYTKHNRFEAKLLPGQCLERKLRNPTGKLLCVGLFDELHSNERAFVTVHPEGPTGPEVPCIER